ncbi:MAG: helix-turn-helix transcriptional regulator [Clostridia bacterium]|nr:helix-turn-helix transcriptional regulator [Clostridia bacterium]
MKLSVIVSEYRQRMQISQREFARRCGLSNSYISFIENETNPRTGRPMVPTLEQYQKIAAGMDMTVHQLFELLDEDAPVDLRPSSPVSPPEDPKSDDIRLLIRGLNRLSPEQVAQAKNVFRAMFAVTNPELFEGDDDK